MLPTQRLYVGLPLVLVPVLFSTAGLLRTCVSLGPPADLTGGRKEGSNAGWGITYRGENATPPWNVE